MAEPQYDFSTLPDKNDKTVSYDLSTLPDKPDPMIQQGMQDFDKVMAGGEEAKADPASYLQSEKLGETITDFVNRPEEYGQYWHEYEGRFRPLPVAGRTVPATIGMPAGLDPDKLAEITTDDDFYSGMYGKSAWGAVKQAFFGKDVLTKDERDKAANIMALSDQYQMSPTFVHDNYDAINKQTGFMEQPPARKFIPQVAMAAAGVTGLSTMSLWKVVLGLAGYEAEERANALIKSHLEKTPYWQTKPYSLADLAPEESADALKTFLEIADLAVKGKALHVGYGGLSSAWDKFAYEKLSQVVPSKRFYIPGDAIRNFAGAGTEGAESPYSDMLLDLRKRGLLTNEDIKDSLKYGLDVEVPLSQISSITDSKIWGNIKKWIRVVPPYAETKVTPAGPITTTSAKASLPAPTPLTDGIRDIGKQAETEGIIPKGITESVLGKEPAAPVQPLGPVAEKVADAAAKSGVDPNTANAIVAVESGHDPTIKNPKSSAHGLFQIIDSTWTGLGGSAEERNNVDKQIELGVKYLRENTQALTKTLGRTPEPWELYIAHQHGSGGASKLLSNPEAKAVDIVGYDAVILNGGTADMTAKQFTDLWQKKFNDRLARAGGKVGIPTTATSTLPVAPVPEPVTSDTILDRIIKPDLSVPESAKPESIDTRMPTTSEVAESAIQPVVATGGEETGVAKSITAVEPWQKTREEHGVPAEPKAVEVPKYPHLEKMARENPESLTSTDKAVLDKQKEAKKERLKYLRDHKQYVEKSNEHRREVEAAIDRGEPVPQKVLSEYPHLSRKAAGIDRGSMIETAPGVTESQGARDDSLVEQIKRDMVDRAEADRQKKIQEQIDKGREIEEYCVDKQGKTKRFTIQKP